MTGADTEVTRIGWFPAAPTSQRRGMWTRPWPTGRAYDTLKGASA